MFPSTYSSDPDTELGTDRFKYTIVSLIKLDLGGLSCGIDFKDFDKYLQNKAKVRDAAGFKISKGLRWFHSAKSVFIAVNARSRWLNNVSCLFLSFPLITIGI